MNLAQGLHQYNATLLKEILKRQGEKTPKGGKAANVKWLLNRLPNKQRLLNELADLNQYEKQALARLRQLDGSTTKSRFRKLLLQDEAIKPSPENKATYSYYKEAYKGEQRYSGQPALEDLLARLLTRGLVFTHTIDNITAYNHSTVIGWEAGLTIYTPDFVLELLDSADIPQLPDLKQIEPVHVVNGSILPIQRDINSYVRAVRRLGTVKLTSQQMLYKADLKTIAADISRPSDLGSGMKETDNGYLFFLRRLLTDDKLLFYAKGGLQAADANHTFFSMNSAERSRHVYRLYRNGGGWNGLRHLPHFERGPDIMSATWPPLIQARRWVLAQIKALGTGWIALEGLLAHVQAKNYEFLFSPRYFADYYGYSQPIRKTPYIQGNNSLSMGFKNIDSEADGWDKIEAGWIAHILAGPLRWLGLVDLTYNEMPPENDLLGTNRPAGYRLTEYGAWALGIGNKPEETIAPDAAGGIILQPNFEVLAMEPLPVDVLMTIDAFATTKDSQQHVTTFELTRESVYRGQQAQWTVDKIVAFFDEHSKMPIPNNVRRTLEEWEGLHERITIRRNVQLVETDDKATSDALASVAALDSVTDTVLLSGSSLINLSREIMSAGYMPIKTRANATKAARVLRISDDGRIRFNGRVPSLFAQGEIATISVAIADGERQIDPTLVRAETAEGQYWHELIGKLKRLSSVALTDELVLNLKQWAHYYGDAKQAELVLIEFRDVAARDELCADPALSEYLTPFAGNRPIAVVSAENIPHIHQQLARRGISISEGLN